MADLEKRLKDDAAAIRADVSPELAARISASIHAAAREPGKPPRRSVGSSLWWASSLTGVAVALVVLALLGRDDLATVDPAVESGQEATIAENAENGSALPPTATVPDSTTVPRSEFPLNAEAAVFAEPLAEELENLKSDLEKARDDVEEDLRQSF